MSNIYHQYQSDGTHLIRVEPRLVEESILEVVDTISAIHQPTQATYITIDLRDNHALPIRVLATEIKRYYRERVAQKPLYLALIVELSVVQVMTTVLKTLMRRDPIQLFTSSETAHQWLILERDKLNL